MKTMKEFAIPVEWVMTGEVKVTATSFEEAVSTVLANKPTPEQSEYLEDSYRVMPEEVEYLPKDDTSLVWFHAELESTVMNIGVEESWAREKGVDLSALTLEESNELFSVAAEDNAVEVVRFEDDDSIEVRPLWATVDDYGNYIDLFDVMEFALESAIENSEAKGIEKGYNVVNKEGGLYSEEAAEYLENIYLAVEEMFTLLRPH